MQIRPTASSPRLGLSISGSLQHMQRESQGKLVRSSSLRKSNNEPIVTGGYAVYTLDTVNALTESTGRTDVKSAEFFCNEESSAKA